MKVKADWLAVRVGGTNVPGAGSIFLSPDHGHGNQLR